jgi:RHS repeat-associated protein
MRTIWDMQQRMKRQASTKRKVLFVCMLVMLLLRLTAPFAQETAQAATLTSSKKIAPYKGTPNRFHPPAAPDRSGPYPGPPPGHMTKLPAGTDTRIHHPFTPSMHELVIPLTESVPTNPHRPPTVQAVAVDATGSDGILEVQVPAGALSTSDIAALGGSASLVVDQVAGINGSTDGGTSSGRIFLGTYTFQVQDAHGHEIPTTIALRQPITLRYHWQAKLAPIDVRHAPVLFTLNPALPVDLPHPLLHAGGPRQFPTTFDPTTQTLNVVVPVPQSGGGMYSTPSPVGYFGKPDAFQNDLHTGSLNETIPIDVPAGPGGLTPDLNLSYSSESIAETHGPQAAASWVGQGWSLDPGEITWSETNIPPPPPNNTTANWMDSWSISDPFGTSGDLLPPNTTTATYYDDSPNPPSGVTDWRTSTESHAKIVSYTNPTVDCTNFPQVDPCGSGGYSVQPPCFRVWLANGILEEFGCTPDSRQWYPGSSSQTTNYVNAWKLDLIADPNGNQIQFTYDQDMTQNTEGDSYPHDVVLKQVQWDAPDCHNANTRCTGADWDPKMEVLFDHSRAVTHWATGAHECTQSGNLRCDDPQGSSKESTPAITPTQVLNEVTVEVAGSGSFQPLRQYILAYSQGAGATIVDPFTGDEEDIAGYLLLEQVTEKGADLSTTSPTQTFAYAIPSAEYYEDSNYTPKPSTNCGPAWNTGHFSNGQGNCLLWSRTYSNFVMTEADNGMGMQALFTWEDMRTNEHGVDTSAPAPDNDPQHAYACTDLQTSKTYGWDSYPCDMADDNGWSHLTLTQRTETIDDPTSAKSPNPFSAIWTYNYNLAYLSAQECADCQYGMYWGNTNDGDIGDFYNGKFTGFNFAQVINPDGSLEDDYYYSTEGWGVWDSSKVTCHDGLQTCPASPAWDLTNAASGRAYQVDQYGIKQNGSYPLLKRTLTNYTAICPTYHVAATPPPSTGWYTGYTWDGHLVSEVDQDNPVALCDLETSSTTTYAAEGQSNPSSSNSPMLTVTNTYDGTNSYGHLVSSTTTGNDLGVTPTIKQTSTYIWDDDITTTSISATGTYIIDRVAFSDTEDGSGNQKACTYTQYDGQAYGTGAQSGLTKGLATQVNKYASCSSGGGTGEVTTKTGYDSNGDGEWTLDADANAGVNGHTGCTISGTNYTTCLQYASPYGTLPSVATNDKGQSTTTHYTATQADGYGLWPSSVTDANGQTTSTAYDALGRTVSTTLPGETTGDTTTAMSYSYSACPATGPAAPCLEVDSTQRLDSSTTVTSEAFYDGWGHLMETRTPGPNNQDVVQFNQYDSMGQEIFQSQPYFVSSGTGYSTPDMSQPGTSYTYDGLGRTLTEKQPNSATTTISYSAACNAGGLGDTACYSETTSVDANSHEQTNFADALGRDRYSQDWSGTSPSATVYRTIKQEYDYLGNPNTTTYADGTHTVTATYNGLDELVQSTDPNLGRWTYGYDPNGNVTSTTDPRGSSGTLYAGYDGLNRLLWQSNQSAGSSPYASYSYDSTANGNAGIGHVTGEAFASGPNQSITGSYAYTYDGRGQQTGWTMTINSTAYPFTLGYNDAGQQTTLTYPDGDLVTTSYSSQDWLAGATETLNSTTTTLLNSIGYSGEAGASQLLTSGSVGNSTYTWALNYDLNNRLDETKVTASGTTLFDQTRTFDTAGNVLTTDTTLPTGTDIQAFCYDEQDRLTWAGADGTPPCQGLTAGTLTSAAYQQSYAYDVLDRLTTGPAGSGYTYGDTTHLDAVTSTGGGYTASYDATGDMTCRAPNSSLTCSGTPTGQQLSYDAMRRLISWQNATNSPTMTATYAYDGEGERVEQQVTTNGTTTTTLYIGAYEEISITGSQTTTTKYYQAGPVTAEAVNGTLYYLVSDNLSSIAMVLTSSGTVQATQLYMPYGVVRYSSGTMPTSYGFTKQRADGSGLDYFNARYYDPTVGAFISVDDQNGRCYTYVDNNPESDTDPSGHGPCLPSRFTKMRITLALLMSMIGNLISLFNDAANQKPGPSPVGVPTSGTATGEPGEREDKTPKDGGDPNAGGKGCGDGPPPQTPYTYNPTAYDPTVNRGIIKGGNGGYHTSYTCTTCVGQGATARIPLWYRRFVAANDPEPEAVVPQILFDVWPVPLAERRFYTANANDAGDTVSMSDVWQRYMQYEFEQWRNSVPNPVNFPMPILNIPDFEGVPDLPIVFA